MMMNDPSIVEITIPPFTMCQKCGHVWVSRTANMKYCLSPKCQTRTWNIPRKEYLPVELTRKTKSDTKTGGS